METMRSEMTKRHESHHIENFEHGHDVRQALLMEALVLRVLRVAEVSHVHDVPRKNGESGESWSRCTERGFHSE